MSDTLTISYLSISAEDMHALTYIITHAKVLVTGH